MTLFVAEIGLNHEGSLDIAKEMTRRAALAGADIVKFQFGWRAGPGELNELAMRDGEQLLECCEHHGVEMMASIISREGLLVAKKLELPRFKIASRTVIDDPELCEEVLAEGRETFISLGMWEGSDWPFGPPTDLKRYIYCVSKYPTPPEDLRSMPESFSTSGYFGYSDHYLGISACLVALSHGAHFIEKHLTLDKSSTTIRDHVLSATPEEFGIITREGRQISALLDRWG